MVYLNRNCSQEKQCKEITQIEYYNWEPHHKNILKFKNETLNLIFKKTFQMIYFNNFSKISKSRHIEQRFISRKVSRTLNSSLSHSQRKQFFLTRPEENKLFDEFMFRKIKNQKSLFIYFSECMTMVPIYLEIIQELENNDQFEKNKLGFLLALGFSMISNLNDVGAVMTIPIEGETYQAVWENGASIHWEAIRESGSAKG